VAKQNKALLLLVTGAVFLFGTVTVYPCATAAEMPVVAKKSCHSDAADAKETQQKSHEKPCCTLHCYNPAEATPAFRVAKPKRIALPMHQDDAILLSLTIAPPYPPPRHA